MQAYGHTKLSSLQSADKLVVSVTVRIVLSFD